MKIRLLSVGKTKPPFQDDEEHYLKMLRPRLQVEMVVIKRKEELGRRIRGTDAYVVALDARGEARDSEQWAQWIEDRRMSGVDVWLLVGGHDGLPPDAIDGAEERVSLGPQTMAHQLTRIVALEQLFRASKIAAGERYHY